MSLKIFYISLLWLCVGNSLQAQNTYNITGKLQDKSTGEPVIGALIRLHSTTSNTLIANGVSNSAGVFSVAVKENEVRLEVTSVGFMPYEKKLLLESDIELKLITLSPDVQILDEVIAKGKIPGAEQRGDTTSFKAKAYKTRPDADAENLISKMPGMEISDGTVKAQGEEVQQVLVDGKPFFGNDPTLAIKSLPAEAIDRIEVFDQQSEQSQFTGFDDGDSKKTLNIVTTKGAKNSQFGKFYAGAGYEGKYIVGGNVNIFNDDQKISLIGLANNVNIQNFASQDLSGMMSSSSGRFGGRGGRRGPGGPSSNGGGSSFNQNEFLVGQQDGIIETSSFGLNFSDTWNKWDISGSYFYNRSDNNSISQTDRTYFLEDNEGQTYSETSQSNTINANHRLNVRANYTINKNQSLIIRPSVNFQTTEQTSVADAITRQNGEFLSSSYNDNYTDIRSYNISNDLVYRLRLGKAGRTLSTRINTGFTGTNADNTLLAITDNQLQEADTLNQLTNQVKEGFEYDANVSFTERITKKGLLQVQYSVSNKQESSDRETFAQDNNELMELDSALSNRAISDYQTHKAGLGYRSRVGKWNIGMGVDYQYAILRSDVQFPENNTLQKHFHNIIPNARIRYNISKNIDLNLMYRARTQSPSVSDLQEVIDNSNPLAISIGNGDLEQEVDHTLMLRFRNINTDKSTNFMAFLYTAYKDNYIGNSTFVAQADTVLADGVVLNSGGELSQTLNFESSLTNRFFINYGFYVPFFKSNLNFSTSGNYSKTPGLVNGVENSTQNTGLTVGLRLSSNISEKVDFNIGTKTSYNIVKNELQPSSNSNYYTQSVDLSTYYNVFDGFFWENALSFQQYFGLGEAYEIPVTLWNMGIGYNFLKEKRAQLKVSVFDLLKQNNSISRTVSDAYVEDTQTNLLQQYYMLTFTYNLRSKLL